MTTFLLEFAIRTTLIAIGTAVVLRLLRIRAATLRHGAWTAVVVAMLVLPVWLAGGVRLSLPVLTPAPEVSNDAGATNGTRPAGAVQPPAVAETQTFNAEAPAAPSSNAPALPALDWQTAVLSLYLAGALVLMLRLLVGTVQANRLRRGAVLQDGRLTSTRCITPITVGWFAPSLILPEGWQHWSAPKLDAVLTHEQAHARRHDTLVQWFALLNRAICWFHPLAWWLERRLSVLAEEACDAAVIAAGHSPHDYSQYLLEMARSVSRDGGRLASIGMAMPGTGLTHRVRLLFQGLPAMRVSRARLACTIAFCAASSVMFAAGAIGERARQQNEAQSPIRFDEPEPDPPARAQDAAASAKAAADEPAGKHTGAQASAAQAPQIVFEAVSIKPCTDFGPGAGRGGNSPRISMTPGYAHFGCITLANLIDHAWGGGSFPDNSLLNTPRLPPDTRPDLPKRVRGGPSWVEDDRWEVEIRMSGDRSDRTGAAFHDWVLTAMAPALQAMIADRFQLKLRKATEQRPMYAMTVAQGGLKITQTAPQKCWERPWNTPRGEPGTPPPGFEGTPSCGYGASSGGGIGQRAAGAPPVAPPSPSERRADRVINFTNINLADFADWLTRILDHGVLNRTSVEGRFSFPLEYAVDDNAPGDTQNAQRSREAFSGLRAQNGLPPEPAREPAQPKGPTIFKALELLGLKMNKTTGPAEYLLIESVQRPRPNLP